MAQVQFQPKINLDVKDILGLVAQLDGVDLDNLKQQIDNLWIKRKSQNVSQKEVRLIGELATRFDLKSRERQIYLTDKSDAQTITQTEREELTRLFNEGQTDYLRRLEVAKKIAKLRNTDFKTVVDEFGLLNPANV